MDKQMIEEMEKALYDYYLHYDDCIGGSERYLAKYLIEKGWIKPAENAVVLTREEQEEFTELYRSALQRAEKWEKLCGIKIKETRKETTEKFAQELENRLDSIDTILHEDNEEKYLSANELGNLICEIAKKIAEGKI